MQKLHRQIINVCQMNARRERGGCGAVAGGREGGWFWIQLHFFSRVCGAGFPVVWINSSILDGLNLRKAWPCEHRITLSFLVLLKDLWCLLGQVSVFFQSLPEALAALQCTYVDWAREGFRGHSSSRGWWRMWSSCQGLLTHRRQVESDDEREAFLSTPTHPYLQALRNDIPCTWNSPSFTCCPRIIINNSLQSGPVGIRSRYPNCIRAGKERKSCFRDWWMGTPCLHFPSQSILCLSPPLLMPSWGSCFQWLCLFPLAFF